MAGTFKGLTQKQIDRKIKEGRGSGEKSGYTPFIYTREVSSAGRSHRVLGQKCQRLHHLLSDLELAVFLILDWSRNTTDIREQFPLRTQETTRIARELGIPHWTYNGAPQVLTSDFLVDFDDFERPQVALQAKYSADLSKAATVERLAVEQAYWREKGVAWAIVTEREVPKTAFANIQWMHGAGHEADDDTQMEHYASLFSREFKKHPKRLIVETAQALDLSYQREPGESLFWLRKLLARRRFAFDISQHHRQLEGHMLKHIQSAEEGEAEHVPPKSSFQG